MDYNSLIENYDDSLLYYTCYRRCLEQLSSAYFEPKSPRVITSNSNFPDFKVIYDSISQSHLLPNSVKKILLLNPIQQIIELYSFNDIKNYVGKFKQDVNDSVLYNY